VQKSLKTAAEDNRYIPAEGKPKILVNLASGADRQLMAKILKSEGYAVLELPGAEGAAAALERFGPDLIITEAAAVLREVSGSGRGPGGVMTGQKKALLLALVERDDEAAVKEVLVAGAADIIYKPVSPLLLCRRVRRLLNEKRASGHSL